MPDYPPPSSQWFANVLARLTAAMQAGAVQSTQYITDPTILTPSATTPNCKAIIGNIGMDNFGNSTGLSGWGTAVWNGTSWQNLNAPIASGTVTVAFSASNVSSNVAVNHGLGVTPRAVTLGLQSTGTTTLIEGVVGSVGSTTFSVQGVAAGAITQNASWYWIAVG